VHDAHDIRIYRKMCRTLAGCGFRVIFIVPCAANCAAEGVSIRALPPRTSRWARFANLLRVLPVAIRERASLYHFHDPELIPVGFVLKLLGYRVVYDVHEDVPKQVLSKHWIPAPLRRIVSFIAWLVERLGAPFWDGIVAATPSIAGKFPRRKTITVQNFPLLSEINSTNPPPFTRRPENIIYVGGITAERGIRQLVEAMSLLPSPQHSKLLLAGSFRPDSLRHELSSAPGWQHVDFHGWCRREEVAQLMAEARAGIVTFLPRPNHIAAQPTKLFEYMSAGLPVIASNFPLWRQIVSEVGCGILVDPERPAEIKNAIQWLFDHPLEAEQMGQRGRRAVQEKFNWDCQSRIMLDFYDSLLNDHHARAA
jgi:glycosyltransferase involved in cell wall biosynthesis